MIVDEKENLLRDNGVRYLLQRIHDELKKNHAGTYQIFAKVPSYNGKVELFNQNKPIDNDEYFLQWLVNKDAIKNIKFEVRNKKKDYIDDLLLTPEEFNTPYVLVSFNIVDKQFLRDLCDTTADIFVLNSYSLEEQKGIVLTAINIIKGKVNNENIILSWGEFINAEDARRIQIVKTLRDLHKNGHIVVNSLDYDLLKVSDDGRVKFTANIECKTAPISLSKDVLPFKSLAMDTKKEIVFYDKLNKWVGFYKRNGRKLLYEVLYAFVKKELDNKIITDPEIFQIIGHKGRMPNKLFPHQMDKVIEVVHHLNEKFQNNKFIDRDKTAGCYRLNP